MLRDVITTLYEYNAWANTRILDTATPLTREQLMEARGLSYESLRDTLVHTMRAQWGWLERWNGRSPTTWLDPREFKGLNQIRENWNKIEADTQAFVASLDEHQLNGVVEYVNVKGERWAYPLWQQMIHQVNHSTQHRSEAAVILTEFGHSPGDLDLLRYIDLKGTTL